MDRLFLTAPKFERYGDKRGQTILRRCNGRFISAHSYERRDNRIGIIFSLVYYINGASSMSISRMTL